MSNERSNTQDAPEQPNGPLDTIRQGRLKMTFWRNEGERGPFVTTDIAKTYTDRDGNPRDTRSLSKDDVLPASHLMQTRGFPRINELEHDLRNERQSMRDVEAERARYLKDRNNERSSPHVRER